jgi:hypothetical protein
MAGGAMYGKISPEMDGEEDSDALLPPLKEEEESDDPIVNLARKAFPESDWTPERASALEELIGHCSGMGGDYGPPSPKGDDMGMGDKSKKATLLLALGGPKKR